MPVSSQLRTERLSTLWNWKTATLSALVRGTIFWTANLGTGLTSAFAAMQTEFLFRTVVSGLYGAAVQRTLKIRRRWLARAVTIAVLPAVIHVLEFVVHTMRGTPAVAEGVAASVAFTLMSSVMNRGAMENRMLLTGPGSTSLSQDLKTLRSLLARLLLAGRRS